MSAKLDLDAIAARVTYPVLASELHEIATRDVPALVARIRELECRIAKAEGALDVARPFVNDTRNLVAVIRKALRGDR